MAIRFSIDREYVQQKYTGESDPRSHIKNCEQNWLDIPEDDEGPGPIKQDDVVEAIGGCQEEICSRRSTTGTKEEKIQSLKANYRDRTKRG